MAESGSGTEGAAGRPVPAGACVRVLSGFYEGLELPIDREWLVLGRGRNAEMMLAEPTLSRAHVAVGYDGGGFFVQDLRSTNGTLLNGERRERAPLHDGDEIQIGRLHLLVRLPGAPLDSAASD
ncbi:FHA domain-containing protein [Myxococcota bacterium]|nr:FHA domain-containing protein [Myxococcota bacterium]MCZ7619430.1 FHA domain-containing protein [Myxococcota bacterium]